MDIYSDFKLPRHVSEHGKKSVTGGHHSGRGRPTHSGSNGNVLGRFLKLGKSKSDANGYGNKSSRSRPASYPHDDCEDDFRITSSRSAVERMVHKVNSRKEVSRSHSWIYGSVKLSSDLPFGYGCGFSPGSTSSSTNSPNSSTQHSSSRPCQKSEFCGSCDCTNDFDFLRPEPSSHHYPPIQDGFSYCTAHGHQPPPGHFQMHHHPGLPYHCIQENGAGSPKSKISSSSHRHKNHTDFANLPTHGALEPTNKFVSSVRKLTWKSLKQAVKKRPSLDNVLKSKSNSTNPPLQFSPVNSPPHMQDDPAFGSNTSYFFPDKKNYYASCTDLYGEAPPYVTASVRVRPKRPRQPWPFPNEFGPVPNYQEEEIYHSEWDLRQFMPYDVWLNATSKSPYIQPIPSESNSVTKIPKITRSASGPLQTVPDISNGHSTFDKHPQKQPLPIRSSSNANKTAASSTNSINGSINSKKGTSKRSSILDPDITAYQLIKPNGKNVTSPAATKIEQSDSDELSDNALNDDPVRIGGQGIYMPLNQPSASTSVSSSQAINGSNPKSSLNSIAHNQSPTHPGPVSDTLESVKYKAAHHSNCRLKPDEPCTSNKTIPDNARIIRNHQPLKKQESRALERGKHSPAFHKPNNHTAIDFQDRSLTATKSLKTYFSQPPPPSPSTSDAHSIYQAAVFNTGHFTNETPSPKYSSDSTFTDESSYTNHSSYIPKQDKDSQTAHIPPTEDATSNRVKFSTSSKDDESLDPSRYASDTSTASSVNRYGALKKRKNRNSSSTTPHSAPHGKVLFKETIYEEESENSDDNKTTYAVKIIVSQNTSSEYVKPILKKERPAIPADESNLHQHSSYSEPDSINSPGSNSSPSSNTSSPYNTQQKPGPRSTKKVQFNHKQTIVCQGLSEDDDEVDDGEESDDTLVREPDLQNEWITVEELGAQPGEVVEQKSPPLLQHPTHKSPADLDKYRDSAIIQSTPPQHQDKNKIHITQVNNPQVAEPHTNISNSLSHNRNNPSFKPSKQDPPLIPPSHPSPSQKHHQIPPTAEPVKNPPTHTHSISPSLQYNANHRSTNSTTSPKSIQLPVSIKQDLSPRTANGTAQNNLPVPGSARIINPNSLLFHDTTRIRLNQTRPSLENSFKLNISGQRQEKQTSHQSSTGGTSTFSAQSKSLTKIKQSNSFRHPVANTSHHIVPAPFRPRDPPPPPPPPAPTKKQTIPSKATGRGRDFPGSKRSAGTENESSKSKVSESSPTHASYTKSQPKIANNQMTVEPPVRNRLSSAGSSSNLSASASNLKKNSQKDSSPTINPLAKHPHIQPQQTQQQRALNALTQQLLQTFSQQNKKPLNSKFSQIESPSTQLVTFTATSSKYNSDGSNSSSQKAVPVSLPLSTEQQHASQPISRTVRTDTTSQSPGKNVTSPAPTTPLGDDDHDSQHNIEIVTRENAVSEIRIYSTPSINQLTTTASEVSGKKATTDNSSDVKVQEMHYAATELSPQHQHHHMNSGNISDNRSESIHYRQSSAPSAITVPQSTSVVLIIDSVSGEQNYSTLPITSPTESVAYNCNDINAPAAAQLPVLQKQIPQILPTPSPTSSTYPPPVFSLDSDNITSRKRAVSNEYVVSNSYIKSKPQTSEPLYDDVINHNGSKEQRAPENEPPHVPPPPVPAYPPPAPSPTASFENSNQEPIYSDASNIIGDNFDIISTYHNNYSSSFNNKDPIIYDDTLSLISSNYGSQINGRVSTKITDILTELDEDGEEPLYDDVINLLVPDSDSGAETEEPPPLPASGPPVHLLSKVSTELPVLNFPLLTVIEKDSFKSGKKELSNSQQYNEDGHRLQSDTNKSNMIRSLQIKRDTSSSSLKDTTSHPQDQKNDSGSSLLHDKEEIDIVASNDSGGNDAEEDILDRTRSLLMELNDKLTKLKFPSNNDYSTYISKVIISSSSESSGVEEDYNSEKNYSLSNVGSRFSQEHYRMNAISKLASETISMARGKFLDSMKMSVSTTPTELPVGAAHNRVHNLNPQSPNDLDEPIYEEIRDFNRSSSPIYADAFDSKSLFESASRNEILSFLESIRDRLIVTKTSSIESGSSSVHGTQKPRKQVDIERNDSGIGSESGSLAPTITPPSAFVAPRFDEKKRNSTHLLCVDCGEALPTVSTSAPDSTKPSDPVTATIQGTSSSESLSSSFQDQQQLTIMGQPVKSSLCKPCSRKRSERKEILQEIYETELKYGRDLKIIEDEFYNPIQTGGLLSKEQLDQIFLNVDQLIQINLQLTTTLQTSIDSSLTKQDDDLITVNVGKIFMEYGEVMMSAFESYCTRQANAGALLAQLEKEKELLRIFLRVSQMENTVLRRMNLPAFLMVPVQRVTRYPLLLARLLKVTPPHHASRDELYLAQEKIENHLEHMNKTTRDVGSVKLWRRISSINGSSSPVHRRSSSDLDGANVRIRKMALDVLDWANFTDVTSVIESQLSIVHFNGKNLRNIYGCLLARGKLESLACKMEQPVFFPPSEDFVKDAELVLVRVKNTRFCLLREPLCLSKCVVSQGENEFQDFIEINEIITKNTYYFQAMDKQGTSDWLRLLQCHALCVGQWRRRRGALANIMMNGMIRHL